MRIFVPVCRKPTHRAYVQFLHVYLCYNFIQRDPPIRPNPFRGRRIASDIPLKRGEISPRNHLIVDERLGDSGLFYQFFRSLMKFLP